MVCSRELVLFAELCKKSHTQDFILISINSHVAPHLSHSTMAAQASRPVLHYFEVAARGELSKLIAAVGGVEMTIKEYPFAVSM